MHSNFRIFPIYDETFKRQVIEEYLLTNCLKKDLMVKYEIGGKGAIQRWMRELGYDDIHRKQKFKFASSPPPILLSMPVDNPNTTELEKRIKELERQLQDEKLRSEAYSRIIEKAEQEFKIPIRKKSDTR